MHGPLNVTILSYSVTHLKVYVSRELKWKYQKYLLLGRCSKSAGLLTHVISKSVVILP